MEEEVDDMQEVRGSKTCKGGEITYFSSELWWFFVRSPLSLAVNLHNFTAFTAFRRKIMYEICGEKTNFSPLILHIFPIFSRPGWLVWNCNLICALSVFVVCFSGWRVSRLVRISQNVCKNCDDYPSWGARWKWNDPTNTVCFHLGRGFSQKITGKECKECINLKITPLFLLLIKGGRK